MSGFTDVKNAPSQKNPSSLFVKIRLQNGVHKLF